MVSVIVPMYNVARYIERCAMSLFNQTYSEIEYIFIDDGSEDDTLVKLYTLINQFSEHRSHTEIIKLETNSGVAVARQVGLDAARGDFVAFVDADDFVPEDFVQNLLDCIEKFGLDIVICDHVHVFSDREVRIHTVHAQNKNDYCALLMTGIIHAGFCNKLIKKRLFIENGLHFSSNLLVLEDKSMMVKLFYYASNIGHCADTVYYYNKTNENSLTSQSKAKQVNSLVRVWDEIMGFYQDKIMDSKMEEAVEFFRIGILASLLFFLNKSRLKELRPDLCRRPRLASVFKQPVIPINNKLILSFYALHLDWAVSILSCLRRLIQT